MALMTNTQDRVSQAVRIAMAVNQETQADLAAVLGVDRSAVSARLKGRTTWSLPDLDALSRHYGIEVSDLVAPAWPMPLQQRPSVTPGYELDTHQDPTVLPFRRPVVGTPRELVAA